MKSIILLIAILAIASARFGHHATHGHHWNFRQYAHRLNPVEVFQGFSTRLGLTHEHLTGGAQCFAELRNFAAPLLAQGIHGAEANLLRILFESDAQHREELASLLHRAQTELPQCRDFVLSLGSIFAGATVSQDEHYVRHNIIRYRFHKYAPEIISTLFTIAQDAHTGRSRQVGVHVASIVRIISGLDHPETFIDYAMNYTRNHQDTIEIETLEHDRFLQQVLNTAAKEFGSHREVTQEQIDELIQDVTAFFQVLAFSRRHVSQVHGVEREVAVLGSLRDVATAGQVAFKSVHNVVAALVDLESFHHLNRRQVRHLAGRVVFNYFKNLPTIQRRVVDLTIESRHHHAASTGKALAAVLKALYLH